MHPQKTSTPVSLDQAINRDIFKVPVLVLILFVLVAGGASWFVEPGTFVEESESLAPGATSHKVWVSSGPPGSGQLSISQILLAPVTSLAGPRGPTILGLIACILIIGASFNLLNGSGALPGLMESMAKQFIHRRRLFLVISTLVFSLMGSVMGMMEEVTPMILFFVPLSLRMGWDRLTGMTIPFGGAACGFAAATLNPFTLGTAQNLAGIQPLYSGLGFRFLLFLATWTCLILFLLWHTERIGAKRKKNPAQFDSEALAMPEYDPEDLKNPRQIVVILSAGIALLVLFSLSLRFLPEQVTAMAFPVVAIIFIVTSVTASRTQECSWMECRDHFNHGIKLFSPVIVLLLLAGSIPHLLELAGIKDTMVDRLASRLVVSELSAERVAGSMFIFQSLLNLIIPGGISQALLTVPILTQLHPGVSSQTVVLAFCLGDGFSNLIWPTNPLLMVALGLAGVRFFEWTRFIFPLLIMLFATAIGFLILAVRIGFS